MTITSYVSAGYSPDALISRNGTLLVSEPGTMLSGQNLARGALLGVVTATGKYRLSLSASDDGSQAPVAILAQDCDAASADAAALVFIRGDFQSHAVTLGAGHTVASVKAALQDRGIFLINSQTGA